MNTGEKIKNIRKSKKITQRQLAELMHKNIRTIQKYESGEIEIPLESLLEISDVLNISINELTCDESILNTLDKVMDWEGLKKDVDEIELFEKLLNYFGYKINYIQIEESKYEIEITNIELNETKVLSELQYQTLKDRLKNVIDFEFYNLKKQ